MGTADTICIVRALGGIGDVLCAVPAMKRIRHANPDARITYLGLPQVRSVVERYPALVDEFREFPGFPGIVEYPFGHGRFFDFIEWWKGVRPIDLSIQMHGSGSVSNVFTALLGAARSVGWFVPGLWRPDPQDYAPFPDALSEVDRWIALTERIGFVEGDASLAFPIADAEREAAGRLLADLNGARYAVVHAGASDPARRWSPDRFALVADDLVRRGLSIVLTGTASEAQVVRDVADAMRTPFVDLCGRTTLGEAAAVIDGARLVVTNDTGTSHLCAALRTPSVVIFIASDPARWAPADDALHIAAGRGVADVPIGQHAASPVFVLPSVDEVLRATTILLEYA